jgi:acetyl-CoA acetyltransferase family protein
MASTNEAVAALLREYAELLAITGGDPFRARNYEKAAKAVAGYAGDIGAMPDAALTQIPGVGKSIAGKIAEYQRTGTIAAVDELRKRIPPGVRELTRVPGLGPKRALVLSSELGIATIADLEAALSEGKLRNLAGFGAKSEERILRGLQVMTHDRVLLSVAMNTATEIVAALGSRTEQVTYAGSLRRMRETVGDVDILATAAADARAAQLMDAFRDLSGEVIVSGPAKTSIRVPKAGGSLQVDLRVVRPEAWGAALQYFTGSQAHNVAVRQIAIKNGLKLSEYGLFRNEELIASATEVEVYAALGMEWVPPTVREDTGEVEAALRKQTPRYVTDNDIRGDLHTHTNLTDGVASLADMIAAAETKGYAYYAVTDHAPNLFMQRMTDEKMLAQRAALAAITSSMTLLHGTELNIAPDGSVDWDEDFLAGFDICVASVHSHFDQDRKDMTRRFIIACENPRVNIIGHPLTRKIGRRPPVDVDLDELFRAAARTGTALEVNASPERLDLPGEHIRRAKDAGVRFAVDTDAHSIGHLDNMKYGVGTAQRGWLTADDVINAWPLEALLEFLRKGRSPRRLLASSIGSMRARDVVFVDGVRTPFGKSGPKGIYAETRADDMVVRVIRELLRRNPNLPKDRIGEVAIAATTQIGDQGLTIGRSAAILAGLPASVPGFAIDRMCAGAMTAVTTVAGEVALGAADVAIAGGVEHMGRHPMGEGVDPNPRFISEHLVDESALFMGMTAENLHDRFPAITKERADAYAAASQRKVAEAYQAGKIQPDLVPMAIRTAELGWGWATKDEPPRPDTTIETLAGLKTPFRPHGRVTAGNSSGINDGATGCVIAAEEVAAELGLSAKMRLVDFSFAGVEPEVMGVGPVPATEKLLARNNLTMDDIGLIEINEAFAVQVLVFLDHFKIADDDPRVNPWGGAIALGHPLASSGVRLMIQLARQFAARPEVRYGLTTMCVGLGMGGTVLWERVR